MTRVRACLCAAAIVTMATLSACAQSTPPTTPPPVASTYGQTLPATFCDAFDFAPLVTALDVGPLFAGPLYNHSGTDDPWYSCSASTQRRDGPDQYRHVVILITINLYAQANSATKEYDEFVGRVQNPIAFTITTAQRAVKAVSPTSYGVLIQDGNLTIYVSTVDQEDQPIAGGRRTTFRRTRPHSVRRGPCGRR